MTRSAKLLRRSLGQALRRVRSLHQQERGRRGSRSAMASTLAVIESGQGSRNRLRCAGGLWRSAALRGRTDDARMGGWGWGGVQDMVGGWGGGLTPTAMLVLAAREGDAGAGRRGPTAARAPVL